MILIKHSIQAIGNWFKKQKNIVKENPEINKNETIINFTAPKGVIWREHPAAITR